MELIFMRCISQSSPLIGLAVHYEASGD